MKEQKFVEIKKYDRGTADGKGNGHCSKVGKVEKRLEELRIKKLGEFSYDNLIVEPVRETNP